MFGNFAQSVEQSQDPGYSAQYFDHYRQMIDAGMDHQAAMNELKRRRQEEEYAKEAEFNSRQASYGKTPEDFAAGADTTGYQRLRAADAAANTGAMPTAEQIWGDQINGGPMGPTEFQSLQDKLLGSGEAAGSAGTGGQSAAPGGGPEVTQSMQLNRSPAAVFKSGDPSNPQSTILSGALGTGVDRLASTVAALPDGHPEKAAYSGLVDQLKQGNVHAIPQALQAAQQPEVNSTLGNSIQAQKDSRAKKFAQAMGMLNEMQHDGKHGFDQINQFFGQIKQRYPEFASGHVRGMTDSQVQLLQKNIEDEQVRRMISSPNVGIPAELYLGRDAKGKPTWAMDPADFIAHQKEVAMAKHQQFGEQQTVTHAEQAHRQAMFSEELKSAYGLRPKPIAENAPPAAQANWAKLDKIALDQIAEIHQRMHDGGDPLVSKRPAEYDQAQSDMAAAMGDSAQQVAAGKQAAQQSTIASQQGNLQLNQDKFADMQQHRDTVTDPMAAEMHDAKLKQMDQASVLADTKLKMAQIGQQMAAKGLEFKQQQIDQAAQKFTYQQTRDAKRDEQAQKTFDAMQHKTLTQEQATAFGQMLRTTAVMKPSADEALNYTDHMYLEATETPANKDAKAAAKTKLDLYNEKNAAYNKMIKLLQTHAADFKDGPKPAAPAASGAFNSGGDAEAAFSSGKIKPGQPFTVSGKQFTFDQNGKAIPAGQ